MLRRALLATAALALLGPFTAAADAPVLEHALHADGWWAVRFRIAEDGPLDVALRTTGMGGPGDARGAAIVALIDFAGRPIGVESILGAEDGAQATASAAFLNTASTPPHPHPLGAGEESVSFARFVAPGEYTLVVAGAGEGFAAHVALGGSEVETLAETEGTEVLLLGERDFQCTAGASARAPGASVAALDGCHAQVQTHHGVFVAYRARDGDARADDTTFSLDDPLGNEAPRAGDRILVANGTPGVWVHRLASLVGAGLAPGAPDVTSLVADVAMP